MRIILTLVLLAAHTSLCHVCAASRRYTVGTMKRMFAYASTVDTTGLRPRDSYAYLKYDIRTNRRNCLLLAIPTMYAIAGASGREHVGETYSRITMARPGDIRAKRLLERTTVPHGTRTMPTLLKYLTPMIYDEMMIDGRILSPFNYHNRSLYRYRVEPFARSAAIVSFRPRRDNTKLVRGWARVELSTGRVLETAFDGEYDMVRFHVAMTTGDEGVASLIPAQCNLNARFLFLGNDITTEYTSVYGLDAVLPDTMRIENRSDTALLNRVRPIPLNSHELYLYSKKEVADARATYAPADSLGGALADQAEAKATARKRSARLWNMVARSILVRTRQRFGTHDQGTFRVSPILNPLFFSYSSRRGLTYKLDIRASYFFNTRQSVQLRFKSGYSFKQKQLYFDLPLTLYINQKRNAYVRAEWSSGRRITNSEVLDAMKREHGDTIDWNRMNLTYFRDHSLKLVANYDLTKRLGLSAGIVSHRRSAVDARGFDQMGQKRTYTSSAPVVEMEYRPTDYNGPILTLSYERSIRGFLGSDMEYERLEADGQYSHRLSALSTLQMRAGTGFYTHKGHGSYFLDYSNFRENNIPGGWNDEWACSFELLSRAWYNASPYYVRANVAYETPLLLLAWMPVAGRLIERERIYVNALSVRRLHPYIEYGYGVTTRAFSLGAFLAQKNWRIDGFTVRLGLELFRHW